MNDKEIHEMLDSLEIPYAYHHFSDNVYPPFMIYVDEPPTQIMADGEVYLSVKNYSFELYSDTKDTSLIQKVEKMFSDRGIRYKKEEGWIESEEMFEILFSVQL